MKIIVVTILIIQSARSFPPTIKIGAIFTEDQRHGPLELAFKYAVNAVNLDNAILPGTSLSYDVQYLKKDDSFHAMNKVCSQIADGAHVIFGPSESQLSTHIQSLCNALDIPHLEARLDLQKKDKDLSINVYPSHQSLNQAFQDVMMFLNWTKVAIIFEEDQDLLKLQDLMKFIYENNMFFLIKQGSPNTYREILKEIKSEEIFNIIVDTNPDHLNFFLRGILQLQMNDYKYHYLLTTLNVETFDLEDFKYNFVNMTAFRLVDSSHHRVKEVFSDMSKFTIQREGKLYSILNSSQVIQVDSAIVHDSVYALAHGLQSLQRSIDLKTGNISCEDEVPWEYGLSLMNYINSVEFRGITGPIQFKEGRRTNFKLDLLKLKHHSLVKVGEWSAGIGVNITNTAAFYDPGTMNVTLLVTTNIDQPFIMMRPGKNFTGNNRFYGFCVDLLHEVSLLAGFEYILELTPERVYGAQDPVTGEWNGIVKQLMTGKADLAIGSMTINFARESVIDFTKPFMNVGISILFKLPVSETSRLFSFMKPLTLEIWLYVIVAYVLVSATLFIVARLSPYEWRNPHPCSQNSETLMKNQFCLSNSFWFTIGTLMQQESELNPKAISTRIVGGMWWFFAIIIISSYTANLAAFLTVERMVTPIESVEDLASQTEIAYGSTGSGSTMTFFRDSKLEVYQKMWRFMANRKPSVFTQNYAEGVKRVLEGNYAFFMESSILDFNIQRNCNLTQIGGMLDSKSYGIATPMGSPWRDRISLAVLDLQEKGVIQMLYNKWWKTSDNQCDRRENKASALDINYIGGIFVVLFCGIGVAIFVSIAEFCWNAKNNTYNDKQSICCDMMEELSFAVRCNGINSRPSLHRRCKECENYGIDESQMELKVNRLQHDGFITGYD